MLMKNIRLDRPATLTIGDVVLRVVKVGERSLKIGIDAPRHLTIDISEGGDALSVKEAVETAKTAVLKPQD